MKTPFLGLLFATSLLVARADFQSYTLVSQSTALTFDPVVTHTFDSLSINFTANSGGNDNYTIDHSTGALVTLSFTTDESIVGHSVQLAWIYPNASTVFEYFPSIFVPGSVDLGFGASDFTITGNTITIANSTAGWTGADFNGFVLTDLTRQAGGPTAGQTSTVPEATSTLSLLGLALAGLAACRRTLAIKRQ